MQAMMASRGQGTAPRSFRPGAPTMGGVSRGTSAPPFHADPRLLTLLHHLVAGGHIPSFAYGGVAYTPQLAVVGDNGPEAMVPLGERPQNPEAASYLMQHFHGGGTDIGKLGGYANEFAANQKYNTEFGGARGRINDLLSGGTGGNAAFGPNYLRDATRRAALQRYSNQRRSSSVLGDLYGLDPMAARGASVNADIGASSDLSNALNNADLAGLSGYQELLQRLLSGERGYQAQDLADMRAAEREKANRPSFLGGLIGQGIGVASKFL